MSLDAACQKLDIFRDHEERETFLRRLRRARKVPMHQNTPFEFFDDAFHLWYGEEDFPYTVEKLTPLADQGSVTARGMLESALLCLVGRQALYDRDYERVAKAFAQAYRKNSLVVLWSPEPRAATMVAMESLYQNTLLSPKVRADSLFVHANLKFALGDYPGGIQEVRLAIHLLPNDAEFYATLGCIYAMQWKAAAALAAFEQCRNLGCDDVEHTLFHRGILSIKDSDMLLLLEEYVKRAEPDGRKVPEACYRLAILYGFKGPAYLGKGRRFYDMIVCQSFVTSPRNIGSKLAPC